MDLRSAGSYVSFHLGVDLAKESDYSAVSVIEKRVYLNQKNQPIKSAFNVIMLKRWERKTSYPVIVNDIAQRLEGEPFTKTSIDLRGNAQLYKMPVFLAVDRTGVGVAVMDLLNDNHFLENRCTLRPIHISGGFRQHSHTDFDSIPKSDLIQNLVVEFQKQESLKIASSLPEASNLIIELENFEMSATRLGNDVFGARSGKHDDLVLSLALSLWSAKNFDDGFDDGQALRDAVAWRGRCGNQLNRYSRRRI